MEHTKVPYYDHSGGINLNKSPIRLLEEESSESVNVDYTRTGSVSTAYGSSILSASGVPSVPNPIPLNPTILGLYNYRQENGFEFNIVATSTDLYFGFTALSAQGLSLTSTNKPDFSDTVTNSGEYLVYVNGVDTNLKFDGTAWTNLSIETPVALGLVDGGAGLLPAGDYQYYVAYARKVLGVIVQISDLSPVSSITIAALRDIDITVPVSTDTQVNCRVIYRVSPTSLGVAYRHIEINDNTTVAVTDNTVDDGTIEAEFDNQRAPTSLFVETNDWGQTLYRDEQKKTDLYYSKPYVPWAVPSTNFEIFDGEITCIKQCFKITVVGTVKSIWIIPGELGQTEPVRVSSTLGILNNRCAVGIDALYILGTNFQMYRMSPTDFSQAEMRLSEPLSDKVDSYFKQISKNLIPLIEMEYYSTATVAKVVVLCPTRSNQNDTRMIFNEKESIAKGYSVWEYRLSNARWNTFRQMVVNNQNVLYGGDYWGLVWKLEDDRFYGDGAEWNGTASGGTVNTLVDAGSGWTVNQFAGTWVALLEGTGFGQKAFIVSNTADTLTFASPLVTAPDATTVYTIGGYPSFHFTNWKSVTGAYETLKELHNLYFNLNSAGGRDPAGYSVKVLLQVDFDPSPANQEVIELPLEQLGSIWGIFIWGVGLWGDSGRLLQLWVRKWKRFRAIRFAIYNDRAGQPWQLNALTVDVTDRKFLYPSK